MPWVAYTSLRRDMCIRSIKICDFFAFTFSLCVVPSWVGPVTVGRQAIRGRQAGITNKLGYGKRVNEINVSQTKTSLSYQI